MASSLRSLASSLQFRTRCDFTRHLFWRYAPLGCHQLVLLAQGVRVLTLSHRRWNLGVCSTYSPWLHSLCHRFRRRRLFATWCQAKLGVRLSRLWDRLSWYDMRNRWVTAVLLCFLHDWSKLRLRIIINKWLHMNCLASRQHCVRVVSERHSYQAFMARDDQVGDRVLFRLYLIRTAFSSRSSYDHSWQGVFSGLLWNRCYNCSFGFAFGHFFGTTQRLGRGLVLEFIRAALVDVGTSIDRVSHLCVCLLRLLV